MFFCRFRHCCYFAFHDVTFLSLLTSLFLVFFAFPHHLFSSLSTPSFLRRFRRHFSSPSMTSIFSPLSKSSSFVIFDGVVFRRFRRRCFFVVSFVAFITDVFLRRFRRPRFFVAFEVVFFVSFNIVNFSSPLSKFFASVIDVVVFSSTSTSNFFDFKQTTIVACFVDDAENEEKTTSVVTKKNIESNENLRF